MIICNILSFFGRELEFDLVQVFINKRLKCMGIKPVVASTPPVGEVLNAPVI
jgi:hypothetical protein